MKKTACILFSIILIFAFVAPSVPVGASENDTAAEFANAVNYTCTYQVAEKRVYIDGTVAHDFLVNHNDYKITVYRILPEQTLEDVLSAPQSTYTAQADMTVKFTFYIDVENVLEQFSKYAIVLVSPSDVKHIAGQPLIPSVSSDYNYNASTRSGFKGINSQSSLNVGDSGAETVIVDVDIGKTRGDSANSIIYPMGITYVHFNKSYISSVDKQFSAALTNNAKVYIRLLLPAMSDLSIVQTSTLPYSLPNLYSADVLEYIYTLSKFISERYGGEGGKLYGIIAGSKIDDVINVNDIGERDISSYAELYTLFLTVVSNAARSVNNKLDMVIPLSDVNDYGKSIVDSGAIRPSTLLEQIVYRLETAVSGNFDCTLLVETELTPINVTELHGEMLLAPADDENTVLPSTIDSLLLYIRNMGDKYSSAPSSVMYLWNVDEALSGNVLASAYAYAYMKLFEKNTVSSFAVKLGTQSYGELHTLIRQIDTEKALVSVEPLCKYFGVEAWEEILQSTPNILTKKKVFEVNISTNAPSGAKGEFQYMDFTSSTFYPIMQAGHNCEYIRTDYDKSGSRILKVGSEKISRGDSLEVMGIFDYPESYIYTPTLSLKVGVEDVEADASAMYEITVTVGMENTRLIAIGALKNGEARQLYFDVEDFAELGNADYIRISARCLTEDSDGMSLLLGELNGHSDEYTSQRLSELIDAERLNIRNEGIDDNSGFNYTTIVAVVGIVVAGAVLAVALLIPLKKDE